MGKLVESLPADLIARAVLVVDDPIGSRHFVMSLRAHLSAMMRQRGEPTSFKKVVAHDSGRDDAIQAADIVAGLAADVVAGGENQHYRLIEPVVIALLRYPSQETENPPG